MRISISDFGPVGYCEYNIDKNLICVFGENNIGKSYSMQVCYLLLKNLAKPNYGYYGYYGYRGRMPIDNEKWDKYAKNLRNVKARDYVESRAFFVYFYRY